MVRRQWSDEIGQPDFYGPAGETRYDPGRRQQRRHADGKPLLQRPGESRLERPTVQQNLYAAAWRTHNLLFRRFATRALAERLQRTGLQGDVFRVEGGRMGVGLRIVDCGWRIADCGLRIADCGLRIADCGLRIADL